MSTELAIAVLVLAILVPQILAAARKPKAEEPDVYDLQSR